MPKVKLIRDEKAERAELRRIIIRKKMVERNYQPEFVISRLQMCKSTFYHRQKDGEWTLEDIHNMDRVLWFTNEELAKMVRG